MVDSVQNQHQRLLYLDGYELGNLPLVKRKAQLKKVTQHTDVQFSDSFEVEGAEVFAQACKVGLEGVVSKVRDSNYVSGRSNNWVKSTCAQRETLTIAGFALDGKDWDGIYVAVARALTWSMRARSTTASISNRSQTCAGVSRP